DCSGPYITRPTSSNPASSRYESFFFQAEDGIRDRNVTGVQTCALPISARSFYNVQMSVCNGIKAPGTYCNSSHFTLPLQIHLLRSEERRVGKECRYRRWQ